MYPVNSSFQVRECVVTVGIRSFLRLTFVESAVIIHIEKNSPAGQSRFAGIFLTVAVEVVIFHTANRISFFWWFGPCPVITKIHIRQDLALA